MSVFKKIDSFQKNFHNPDCVASRPCPLCGSERFSTISMLRDFQFFSDSDTQGKRVDIQDCQCMDCLTLYRNPSFTPSGFSALFAEAGCSYGSTAQRPQEQIDWLSARKLLKSNSIFLDVGCYEGSFLARLPGDLLRMGVDIDAPAIARGRVRYPELSLTHSAFDEFEPVQPPQVITMFHVLEHLPNPKAVLQQLRNIGGENVKLVVEVPIVEGGETNDINGFFSPQHLTHFSRNSLQKILFEAGWNIIETQLMQGYNGCRVLAEPATTPYKDKNTKLLANLEDMGSLQKVLQNWYLAQMDVEACLSNLPLEGNFVIWGAGMHTELLYQKTTLFHCPERSFLLIDSDPLKQGNSWRGISIVGPEEISMLDCNECQFVVSSYGNQNEIRAAAADRGVPMDRIHTLYSSVSVY